MYVKSLVETLVSQIKLTSWKLGIWENFAWQFWEWRWFIDLYFLEWQFGTLEVHFFALIELEILIKISNSIKAKKCTSNVPNCHSKKYKSINHLHSQNCHAKFSQIPSFQDVNFIWETKVSTKLFTYITDSSVV